MQSDSWRFTCYFAICVAAALWPVAGERPTASQPTSSELRAEPQLVSIFPLGGRQGSTFRLEIRGKYLQDVYDSWFDCQDLKGRIQNIQKIEATEEPAKKAEADSSKSSKLPTEYLLSLEIDTAPQTLLGAHQFRLISPGGISNALLLQISSEPTVLKNQKSKQAVDEKQEINPPAAIYGKIDERGEVDYYSFLASKDEEWLFEIRSGEPSTFDPVLTLYEPLGSWFDPTRVRRLAMNDEPQLYGWNAPRNAPCLSYQFSRSGRYIVAVQAFAGLTNPHCSYQLRVLRRADLNAKEKQSCVHNTDPWPSYPGERIVKALPAVDFSTLAHNSDQWKERDFLRRLDAARVAAISSRTLNAPERSTTTVMEREPNDTPAQALSITVPALLEGTIERPGDFDFYKFKVEAGEGLTFEIETPEQPPYHFMPNLVVLDTQGKELVNNLYRRKSLPDRWYNFLEPKTVYRFEQAGEYYVQVRDLTLRKGDSNFRYRILVRQQIPHMGEVKITEDHISLYAGQARRVSVTVEQEEGFDGDVTLSVDNLPPGVQLFPAAELTPEETGVAYEVSNPRYVPKNQNVTLMFVADPEAPASRPYTAEVKARAVVGGKPGELKAVKQILFMVMRPEEKAAQEKTSETVAQKK
ncbi:MAG TPA: hypothetical protein VGQ81_15735 [Acidobacteriota bacterium]|nr:hypothetical protein [Acidobacteriota bacterium]